jgi:Tfp pilus assembly protein PilO
MNIRRIRLTLIHQISGMGWVGAIGLAFGIIPLAIAYVEDGKLQHQLDEIARQRSELARRIPEELKSGLSPQEILTQFLQRFPSTEALPDILIQLDAKAHKHGLIAPRADYGESSTPQKTTNPIQKIRISMPIKGDYVAIRAWLSDVLTSTPTLDLESLELQRQKLTETELSGQVRLIVYLRKRP